MTYTNQAVEQIIYIPYPNKPLYSVIQHQRKLILEVPNSVRDYCLKNSVILTEQWFYTNSKLYHLLFIKIVSVFNSKKF